jgi:hypothetical protein
VPRRTSRPPNETLPDLPPIPRLSKKNEKNLVHGYAIEALPFEPLNFEPLNLKLFMNKLNKFARLSPEEQKFVIDLCDQHGYDKAQELLAEDRPVGLNFNTSRASLCRYYSRYHPDAAQYIRSAEHANALQVRHQAADGALTEGTLALVQSRIFESLQKGRPLADMAAEFRIFNQVHRAFLTEDAWRRKNGIKTKDKYYGYIKTLIGIPQCDFGRNDIEDDPGSEGVDPVEFDIYETDEELDVFVAEVQERKARARDCAAKQAQAKSAADPGSVGPGVMSIFRSSPKPKRKLSSKHPSTPQTQPSWPISLIRPISPASPTHALK